jgi:hypothetical protein
MKKIWLLFAFCLAACGGAEFADSAVSSATPGTAGASVDAEAGVTGGAAGSGGTVNTGGTTSVSTGGAAGTGGTTVVVTGGSAGSSTGGSGGTTVNTGGSSGTGGSTGGTGGTTTGGAAGGGGWTQCPALKPTEGFVCNVNINCSYDLKTCWCDKVWVCDPPTVTPDAGVVRCPATKPLPRSACTQPQQFCFYSGGNCTCEAAMGWICV